MPATQLDIQQILALDAVIQIAGQLEGVAAGHIQGQLEDELACAVLAVNALAVCPYGDRLAPRRQGIEGVEAGYIQLQETTRSLGGDRPALFRWQPLPCLTGWYPHAGHCPR